MSSRVLRGESFVAYQFFREIDVSQHSRVLFERWQAVRIARRRSKETVVGCPNILILFIVHDISAVRQGEHECQFRTPRGVKEIHYASQLCR